MPSSPIAGFDVLYLGALGCYLAYLIAELVGLKLRTQLLASAVAVHLLGLLARTRAIEWFPLTNKFESFYAFAFAVFVVALLSQGSPSRVHRLGLWLLGAAFYGWAYSFGTGAIDPPPLMRTLWYPLHVPASFTAYALWSSAAAAGVATLSGDDRPQLQRIIERQTFWGWCSFSLSMLCGGAWGYVAWGAYFLWDPKVVWSVILWLLFSGLVHLRYWPAGNRPLPRSVLAIVGLLVMLVAYVGTSFLFHHGSHSFS
jgi:ABC-type transport system involved in cytochrome c biogenesis permease subunit